MYDKNAKSERILTKLSTFNSECIFEKTTKFRQEILLANEIIDLQNLVTK